MKSFIAASFVLFAFSAGQAMASCPHTGTGNTPLNTAGVKAALGTANTYHCAIRGSGSSLEKWNETLRTSGSPSGGNSGDSGTLTDFKRGPGDPSDPRAAVGTWSIPANTGRLTYNYGTGGAYTYTVKEIVAGTTYELCNVSTNELFTVTVSTAPTSSPTTCP
jgi:hypothetical protein